MQFVVAGAGLTIETLVHAIGPREAHEPADLVWIVFTLTALDLLVIPRMMIAAGLVLDSEDGRRWSARSFRTSSGEHEGDHRCAMSLVPLGLPGRR